jgi:chromosomal replication initiator protein
MAFEALHIPTPEEVRARRARLGVMRPAPVVRLVRQLPPPPAPPKPLVQDNSRKIVAKYRCVLNIRHHSETVKNGSFYAMRRIVEEVSEETGVSVKEIVSPCRDHRIIRARQACYYRGYYELKMSCREIGKHFGGKDHTTIAHGIAKHQERIDAGTVGP